MADASPPEPSGAGPPVVRNDSTDGRAGRAELAVGPRSDRPAAVPDGDGPVTVEVHADGAAATLTVRPESRPAPFAVRGESVVVAAARPPTGGP